MELFDKLYEKVKGGYFAICGALIFFIMVIISISLYLVEDPSFSIFRKFVSEVGAGPIGPAVIMNVALISLGVSILFFIPFYTQFLQKHNTKKIWSKIGGLCGILFGLGVLLVGIFPGTPTFIDIHQIGAAILMLAPIVGIWVYSISELKSKTLPNSFVILSIIVIIFDILVASLLIINYGLLQRNFILYGTMYSSDLVLGELMIFAEWMFFFSTTAWLIIRGIFTIKHP